MVAIIFLIFTIVEVWATIKVMEIYFGIICSFEYGLVIAAMALITNGGIFWLYLQLRKHSTKNDR